MIACPIPPIAIRRHAVRSNGYSLWLRQLITRRNPAARKNRQKITFTSERPACIANRVTVVSDPKQQAEKATRSVARKIELRPELMRKSTLALGLPVSHWPLVLEQTILFLRYRTDADSLRPESRLQ